MKNTSVAIGVMKIQSSSLLYRVILAELAINTLPRYTIISNAAVGKTIYN
jgi:hypothetical protein